MIIDQRLMENGVDITDLPLCRVLLVNNAHFPWIILVPRQNVTEIIDLSKEDQHHLMDEIALASQIMQSIFSPDKLNVAALGNIVPQLHIHIVARFKSDRAWPHPVFGGDKTPYEEKHLEETVEGLKTLFDQKTKI